jgi:hypothetical protein
LKVLSRRLPMSGWVAPRRTTLAAATLVLSVALAACGSQPTQAPASPPAAGSSAGSGATTGSSAPASTGASSAGAFPKVMSLDLGSTSSTASAISFLYETILRQIPMFFQQAGLKVSGPTVPSGQVVQLVQSGSLPVAEGSGLDQVLSGQEHGITNVKIFAGEMQKPAYDMVVRKGITSLTQIKTLGVPAVTSASAVGCEAILRSVHEVVNQNYSLVLLGTSGSRVAAVQAGKVDGSCELLPYPQLYHDKYGMTILAQVPKYLPDFAIGAWIFNDQWAQQPANHEALVRLSEAILLAGKWVMDPANASQVASLVAKTFNVPQVYGQDFYQQFVKGQMMTPDGYVPEAAAQGVVSSMQRLGLLKGTAPSLSSAYDWSFLQEAAKRLGMQIRQPTY